MTFSVEHVDQANDVLTRLIFINKQQIEPVVSNVIHR